MVWNGNVGVEYVRYQNGIKFQNGMEDNLLYQSHMDFVHGIYRKIYRNSGKYYSHKSA